MALYYGSTDPDHARAQEREDMARLNAELHKRRFDTRIVTEPTGLPSGGYYVSCDGVALHSKQGHRHRRIFQSEYRGRKAGREYLRERERDEEAARLAQRRTVA